MELELALDTDSGTYCLPRGEQIAYAVDEAATENSRLKGPYYQGYVKLDCIHVKQVHYF